MRTVDRDTVNQIKEIIYDYFALECEVSKDELSDETDIIEDLEGDSLMLLSLLEIIRKKFGLTIELKTLGKHLIRKPAQTLGQVVDLTVEIVKYGDDIVDMEL